MKTAAQARPMPDEEREERAARPDTVSALERGIAVLRCFSEERRLLTPTELSRLTGIPRPTATRLAQTLCAQGLLKQDPATEGYMLGPGVVSLARVFLAGLDVRAAARPHMQALADQFSGSVYLAIRDGLEMVLVEACRARASMLAARLDVGSRAPIATSALGRAYLAAIEPAEREALIETLRLSRGAEWSMVAPGLKRSLAEAAAHGWCISAGEFHREINSVSVPLVGPGGEVMALNCGGAAFHFTEELLRAEVAPRLLAIAHDIANEIGGHVPPHDDEAPFPARGSGQG